MLPYFSELYANPASAHGVGQQAAEAVKQARASVAALIGADPAEIIFTSGATESNNLAIVGLAKALSGRSSRRRIVTTAIEHKAVLDPCAHLAREGYEVVFLPVDSTGRVVLGAAREVITDRHLAGERARRQQRNRHFTTDCRTRRFGARCRGGVSQ